MVAADVSLAYIACTCHVRRRRWTHFCLAGFLHGVAGGLEWEAHTDCQCQRATEIQFASGPSGRTRFASDYGQIGPDVRSATGTCLAERKDTGAEPCRQTSRGFGYGHTEGKSRVDGQC